MMLACSVSGKTATPTPTAPPPATPTSKPTSKPMSKPTSGPTPTLVITLPFFDDFSVIKNGWLEGSHQSDYADTNYAIVSGKFQWTENANKGVFESAWPDLPALSSFTLTVDAQQVSGKPDQSGYAVIFVGSDGEQKYVFEVSNNHYEVFYYDKTTDWQTIAPLTVSNTILPGKVNHIKVVSADSHFTFYVNEINLFRFTDNRIPEGQPGLGVEVFNAGDTSVIEFDNFTVTNP
jgi:hypothetical protein